MPLVQTRGGQAGRPGLGQLGEEGQLPRPEPALIRPAEAGQPVATGCGDRDPAFEARPGRCGEQRPVEADDAACRESAKPPDEGRPPVGRDEVAHGLRAAAQLVDHVTFLRLARFFGARGQLGDELEPFEDPGRQHRPQDDRGRGEIGRRDPAGEGQRQRRQQRPIRPDPVEDGFRGQARHDGRLGEDHGQGLPAAVLHEDRLARDHVGQPIREMVGVGPVAAATGRVDRHFDEAPARRDRFDQPERRRVIAEGWCRRLRFVPAHQVRRGRGGSPAWSAPRR